jgi:hypothetical protein
MNVKATESVNSSGPMGDVEITIRLNLKEAKTVWLDMCDITPERIEPSTNELRSSLQRILKRCGINVP